MGRQVNALSSNVVDRSKLMKALPAVLIPHGPGMSSGMGELSEGKVYMLRFFSYRIFLTKSRMELKARTTSLNPMESAASAGRRNPNAATGMATTL